jgi:hypothetical protein
MIGLQDFDICGLTAQSAPDARPASHIDNRRRVTDEPSGRSYSGTGVPACVRSTPRCHAAWAIPEEPASVVAIRAIKIGSVGRPFLDEHAEVPA